MIKIKVTPIYNWVLYKQILFTCVLMIIIFIFINKFLLKTKKDTYFHHIQLETNLKEEYISKYATYKNLATYDKQNKQLIKLNTQLINKFPNKIEDLRFEINQLIKNNFLQINEFQPQNTKSDINGLFLQVIKINLSGEYINFVNFIMDLYKISNISNITNLNIIRNNDNNITVDLNVNLHFISNL